MSELAIQNRFDGGHAEDVRTENTNECESSDNFDTFTNPHMLIPYIDMVAETVSSGTLTDFSFTDVDTVNSSGTPYLVALAELSSVNDAPAFYRKSSSSSISASWQYYATGSGHVDHNTLCIYNGLAYCIAHDNTPSHNLQKYDGVSTVTTIGTITNTGYSSVVVRPFVHPEDNIMYMVDGNIIASYNVNTAIFTASAFVLPADKVGVSLTALGGYLVITCRPKYGIGNSVMYYWGRDASVTTLQESIDLGACQVNIVENIDNQLVVISSMSVVGSYANISQNRLTARIYAGGSLQPIKELTLSSTFGTSLNNFKVKKDNKIYFGFDFDTSFYVFGKNKEGRYSLGHSRALPPSATNLTGFSIVGDIWFVAYNTNAIGHKFARTLSIQESAAYVTSCVYRTTINPSMKISHRSHAKQLEGIQILVGESTSGTVLVKYSVDGSTFATVETQTNATGVITFEALGLTGGVNFLAGREYQFEVTTTGNTPVKEIRYRYSLLNQAV